jgi:hypothetical protein
MVRRISVLVVLALAFVLPASSRGATQSNWVYLQNGSNLRISIETYQARDGWTPVIVSVAGADVSAVMDAKGRVFRGRGEGLDGRGVPLFTVDLEKGNIQLGRETHVIRVYEQNGVRTSLAIAESTITLPLCLDQGSKTGTLRFGGLEIPATVNSINPTRTAGNRFGRGAAVALQVTSQKGHGAFAQLTPSRIRARGK